MAIQDGITKNMIDIDSFLMVGQSNMAGRGHFGEVEPIDNDMCFMLRMGRWQKMSEPINPDRAIFQKNFHSGIGLAASFSDEYAKHFSTKTGLIPCADGGTGLVQWMPDEVLFDHAVMQARLAMRSSQLKAILWHQGENDCQSDADFACYEDRFVAMITRLREETGNPDLPVVIGEISDNITEEWGMEGRNILFNRRLHNMPRLIKNCVVAPSKGLALNDDGIHFNSASCREFGKRYFKAYCELVRR